MGVFKKLADGDKPMFTTHSLTHSHVGVAEKTNRLWAILDRYQNDSGQFSILNLTKVFN